MKIKELNWKEKIPKKKTDSNGLPVLYLCQVLMLDMTFGYRYTYRIGFVTEKNNWNIEEYNNGLLKVIRYTNIIFKENDENLIKESLLEDIQKYENFFLEKIAKKNSETENKN